MNTVTVRCSLTKVNYSIPQTLDELYAAFPNTERNALIALVIESALLNLIYRNASGLPTVRAGLAAHIEETYGVKRTVVYRLDKEGQVKTDEDGDPIVDESKSESEDDFIKRAMSELVAGNVVTEDAFVADLTARAQAIVNDPANALDFTARKVSSGVTKGKLAKKWIDMATALEAQGKLAGASAKLTELGFANDGTVKGVAAAIKAKVEADQKAAINNLGV